MHHIKSAARRHAWYHNNDGQNRTYNFYGRVNSNSRKLRDEELGGRGLPHRVTDSDAVMPGEAQRRADFNAPGNSLDGPRKARTFPQGPRGNLPREPRQDSAAMGDEKHGSGAGSGIEATNSVPSMDNDRSFVDHSVGSASGARKRKLRKFIPFMSKNPEENGQDLDRTGTISSKKKNWPKPTFWGQAKAVFGSWINILLVFVPVGIAVAQVDSISGIAVFVINFVAIIPLAAMLSFATEELALYVGETLGGLLNASFGNAVELIVSIIALAKHKILIVQTSLIGSMLSNLLLVLGMCFFCGGLNRREQFFNITVAQTAASLLALAIGSLIIPTALLVVYGCYLLFQLRTHIDMYNEPSQKAEKLSSGKKESGEVHRGLATMGAGSAAAAGGEVNQQNLVQQEEEEEEVPQLTRLGALVTLAGSTVLVAFCAEYMVAAIDSITGSVSEEFVGLILLPIVGNAAEHATAVTVAIKDKMDLAIGVAIGSSLQIALLVLPLMVVIGWIGLGQPDDMTLSFDGFQVAVLFISIILVNYLIQDGKSHWLEGVMLMITYMIIAVSAWFYPAPEGSAG